MFVPMTTSGTGLQQIASTKPDSSGCRIETCSNGIAGNGSRESSPIIRLLP
jgi:hypothetical protein